MSFYIEQSSFDKCIVIMKCCEKLVHPDCVPLRTAVFEQVRRGRKAIILDLLEITSINSSEIAEIVGAYADALNYNSRLFCAFSKKIIRSIEKWKNPHVTVPKYKTLEDLISEAQVWCQDQNIYDRFANTDYKVKRMVNEE